MRVIQCIWSTYITDTTICCLRKKIHLPPRYALSIHFLDLTTSTASLSMHDPCFASWSCLQCRWPFTLRQSSHFSTLIRVVMVSTTTFSVQGNICHSFQFVLVWKLFGLTKSLYKISEVQSNYTSASENIYQFCKRWRELHAHVVRHRTLVPVHWWWTAILVNIDPCPKGTDHSSHRLQMDVN